MEIMKKIKEPIDFNYPFLYYKRGMVWLIQTRRRANEHKQ